MPQEPDSPRFGPEEFAACAHVSRETLARLKIYASMLTDWNERHNLVSRSSMNQLWKRHFWDSAQLFDFIPEDVHSLVDLGSGAGFPALVIAEMLRPRSAIRIVLYESVLKKADFLRTVCDQLKLVAEIRQSRIEESDPEIFDLITARACAPLPKLLAYAQRFWGKRTIALFLKGQNVGVELTEANKSWSMTAQSHPSRSDPTGILLEIRELHRAVARPKFRT
jgi:16S rRNA (guanine527-N7)-methyltransferase